MSEQDANPNSPTRVPGNRRFRGIAYALIFVIGSTIIVAVFFTYKDYAAKATHASCLSNLKQLGLAIQKYHEQNGSYPPAFVKGKDGKPAHSWRVLILPFLGRQDLYDAYHFDEPWDSPSNLRLVEQMPEFFACPGSADRGRKKTSYVAVVGSQTIWPGDRGAKEKDAGARFDQPWNTILLVEIADSDIAWTEPRDVRMDEIIPPDDADVGPRFASGHIEIVNVVYGDGAVKAINKSISRNVLYTLLTAWGGKPYQGEWLPGENPVASVGDFPPEKDAKSLLATDVLPHSADPIKADRNYIYCATFQVAWEDFHQLVGGDPQLAGHPSLATALNGPAFPRASLDPTSYVAHAGLVKQGIREKIAAQMAEKFPGITPSFSNAVGADDFICYAFLQKNLPFAVRFVPISEALIFHSTTSDVKVKSFGFNEVASASSDAVKLKDQIDVLHYASDEEFVIRLKPKTDEIVLAKVRPGATLGETLHSVQKLIGTRPKGVDRPRLEEKDMLIVPRLRFNLLRNYDELKNKHLENPGKEDWQIAEAKQAVRFLFNESGARLESEIDIWGFTTNGHTPKAPPPPRKFILDRPFLLYLKEKTAEQPYFVIWVANAELMEPGK